MARRSARCHPVPADPEPTRAELAAARAAVRRGLRAPPPDRAWEAAWGSAGDPARDWSAPGTGRLGDAAPHRRRRPLLLAAAALPLVLTLVLALGGSRSEPEAAPGPSPGPESIPSPAAVLDEAGPAPAENGVSGTSDAGGIPESGNDAEADRGVGEATVADRPSPPPGHRLIALRPADPAAATVITAGDAIDVVGLDGTVLADEVRVLQSGSGPASTELWVAVAEEAAVELAAALASQEVTALLSDVGNPSAAGPDPATTDRGR